MFHRPHAAALAAALFASGLFASSAMAAPATGDVISTGGTVGVDLVDVSADGRYVLIEDSYAELPRTLLLVDRVTRERTPVLYDDASTKVLGTNTHYRGLDVSDDGNLVLIGRYDRQYGEIDRLFVFNRTTRKNTTVGTLPSGDPIVALTGLARFTGGGTGVVYGAADAAGTPTTYRRATLSTPATVLAAGVAPASITRSGNAITWSRPLLAATPPIGGRGASWPTSRTGIATGYTIAGQPSKVVGRTKIVETAGAPEPFCIDGGVTAVTTTPAVPRVDDYGQAIRVGDATSFDERFPSGPHVDQVRLYDVSEDGLRTLSGITPWQYPYTALGITTEPGATGLPVLPELTNAPQVSTYAAKFFAHGTGIVRHEYEMAVPGSGKVVAYGEIGAGTAPTAKTPAAVPGATDDTASLQPEVSWAKCGSDTSPPATHIGALELYAKIELAKPVTTSKPAGTVKVHLNPSKTLRAVPQVTIKVQTLGFTTWSRTIKADEDVRLPRPYWLLPQTVVVNVKVAADPAIGAPADERQASLGWQAFR